MQNWRLKYLATCSAVCWKSQQLFLRISIMNRYSDRRNFSEQRRRIADFLTFTLLRTVHWKFPSFRWTEISETCREFKIKCQRWSSYNSRCYDLENFLGFSFLPLLWSMTKFGRFKLVQINSTFETAREAGDKSSPIALSNILMSLSLNSEGGREGTNRTFS
jgi:hypothetical protein